MQATCHHRVAGLARCRVVDLVVFGETKVPSTRNISTTGTAALAKIKCKRVHVWDGWVVEAIELDALQIEVEVLLNVQSLVVDAA